jgi:carbohydrate kinase (thermoresistant glucokinase family)
VYLEGSFDLIMERMQKRKDHFMKANMLKSQFETLEIPHDAIRVSIADPLEVMVQNIIDHLSD